MTDKPAKERERCEPGTHLLAMPDDSFADTGDVEDGLNYEATCMICGFKVRAVVVDVEAQVHGRVRFPAEAVDM